MTAIPPAEFDPRNLPDAFYENPYPTYERLRSESPVHRCPDGSVFLTRYADAFEVYRDPKRFSSDKALQFAPVFGKGSPLYEHHTTSLVFNDPPLPSVPDRRGPARRHRALRGSSVVPDRAPDAARAGFERFFVPG